MKKIHLKKYTSGSISINPRDKKKIFFFLKKKINNYRVKYDF